MPSNDQEVSSSLPGRLWLATDWSQVSIHQYKQYSGEQVSSILEIEPQSSCVKASRHT